MISPGENGSGELAPAEELALLHGEVRERVEERLDEFKALGDNASEFGLFRELVFCILTPQSRARSCWEAVEELTEKDLLLDGDGESIAECIRGRSRFHRTKAHRVLMLRELFTRGDRLAVRSVLDGLGEPAEAREWLVGNVNGLGYKEASHFLRNIGRGGRLAILDRHILGNLVWLGVIPRVPSTLPRVVYLDVEERMRIFAAELPIGMDHLDLVLWYKQTGEVFK